jgi:glutaminyl-peptide cyclotransferase
MFTTCHLLFKPKEAIRILLFLMFSLTSCEPSVVTGADENFSSESAYAYVEKQLTFGPRYPGAPGRPAFQDWLNNELTQLGWVVVQQSFDYKGATLVNFIASHPENEGTTPIILGAHYDTRRFADRDAFQKEQAVPGANDGASGVAVLIELARVFKEYSPRYDLVLVFFDGEDQGRIQEWDWAAGSRYYVDHLILDPSAVVIVDMVGDQDLNLPYERSSDPDLVASIWATGHELGYEQFLDEPGPSLIDDHIPFIQKGIPAIDIIDFTYPQWHTTADQLDKVSADSLDVVGKTLERWLKEFSSEDDTTQ